MSCECEISRPIPSCADSLYLGIAAANTDYNIFIENAITGRISVVGITSYVEGLINFTMPFEPDLRATYNVSIAVQGDTTNAPVTFYIDNTPLSCVQLLFQRINGGWAGDITVELE